MTKGNHYPSEAEIRDRFTAEQIDRVVSDLSHWETSPVELAKLSVGRYNPAILHAWADLGYAIQAEMPSAELSPTSITRELTIKELREKAVTKMQNALYSDPEWTPEAGSQKDA